jgi:methylmalonyl-CoA/ethylmalonyl-CoA epimerase
VTALPLDHVAIAVASLDESGATFARLLGTAASGRERVASQGVEVMFLATGTATLELIAPLSSDSPVGRFLASRGPGLHHIAFRVADLEATLRELAGAGLRLVDREPRIGAHGRRIAFVHPASAGGVLIELVEG